MTDEPADRIARLRGENVVLMNAIQNAQWLVAQRRYIEANELLSRVIKKLLETPPP